MRRQRTMSTTSSTVRCSSATPSSCSARHALPALPAKDLAIPLPRHNDVNCDAMPWWNPRSKHVVLDWAIDNSRLATLTTITY